MSKYENHDPIPAKFLLPDGTITDKMPTLGSGDGTQDVNVKNLPENLTANGALKVSDYAIVLGPSVVESVSSTKTDQYTSADGDIFVIQASSGNTKDIRFGNQNGSYWLMAGMMATWYGPLTLTAPDSASQDYAITPYKR